MPQPSLPPLAVTMGEPAGIGGEVALSAWLRRREELPPFVMIDDPDRLAALARHLGWAVPVRMVTEPEQAAALFREALPVLPQRLTRAVRPGQPDDDHAPAVVASIERAVALTTAGRTAAVVTNPILKRTLTVAGIDHPGHTTWLAELAGSRTPPIMMLACEALRVVPVTVHMALRSVFGALTTEAILAAARITAAALVNDFGIATPRLAVAALNPHAGEEGAFGREEIEVIAPAVATLRAEGLEVSGPAAADSLFHERARRNYDAVICMYHDQALIPLKTIDFDGGVNITLGLPFVRTSPDHGTALDIAGSGQARDTSFRAALAAAAAMAARRTAAGRRRAALG